MKSLAASTVLKSRSLRFAGISASATLLVAALLYLYDFLYLQVSSLLDLPRSFPTHLEGVLWFR